MKKIRKNYIKYKNKSKAVDLGNLTIIAMLL